MVAFKIGALPTLGLIGCATERDPAREAAEDVKREVGEAREEVGREVQEGREEVAEARANLVDELREMEKSGEAVEFEGVVTGHDQDTVMFRLENGETFEVDYGTQTRFRRGENVAMVTELVPGTAVNVTYRIVDGRRIIDELEVSEGAAPRQPGMGNQPGMGTQPGMQPGTGTQPGMGTQPGTQPGGGTR